MPDITLVTPPIARLGESPIWDVDEQRLYWSDHREGLIFRHTADGREIQVSRFPGRLSSFALRTQGGAIITSETEILLLDLDTGETQLVFDAATGPTTGFNDATVDRQGRFVTGISDRTLIHPDKAALVDRFEPPGFLMRVDPDLTVHRLTESWGITNGPAISPDGRTLFFNDSWSRRVYGFDYDPATGTASNQHVVAQLTDEIPDGATTDAEGYLWVAAFYGGEVRRYAPDGTLDRRVPMPLPKPTSVMFGGPDLDILFVTSMGNATLPGDTVEPGPLGGSLLAVHGLGAQGVPEPRFAG